MSRMATSRRIWPCHVANGRVMSHMAAACRNDRVISQMAASCRKWPRPVANGRVMSPMAASCRKWLRHVAVICRKGVTYTTSIATLLNIDYPLLPLYSHIHLRGPKSQPRLPQKHESSNHIAIGRFMSQMAVCHVVNGCLSRHEWLYVMSQMVMCHVANY